MRTSAAAHTLSTTLAPWKGAPAKVGRRLARSVASLAILMGPVVLASCSEAGDPGEPSESAPPNTASDAAAVGEDDVPTTIDILSNDSDPDGGVLELEGVDGEAATGSVVLSSDQVLYDPRGAFDHLAPGDAEEDSFEYTVSSSSGVEARETVTVTVTGAEDAPACTDSGTPTVYVDESVRSSQDGSSWETAFATVEEGVAAASSGGRVCIGPGVYDQGNQIDIDSNLTLEGAIDVDGPLQAVVLDGSNEHRLVNIQDTTARLVNLELRNGLNSGYPNGGAILAEDSTVTLVDARVIGATGFGFGGGIYSVRGELRLEGDTLIAENEADDYGGGVYVDGDLYIGEDTRVLDNFSDLGGGGLFLAFGQGTLVGPEIRGNTSNARGGGIDTAGGSVVVQAGTRIINNTAAREGGGIDNGGSMELASSVEVSGNASGEDGGGVFNAGDLTLSAGTEVANNSAGAGFNGGGIYNDGAITGDSSGVTGNEPDDVYTP